MAKKKAEVQEQHEAEVAVAEEAQEQFDAKSFLAEEGEKPEEHEAKVEEKTTKVEEQAEDDDDAFNWEEEEEEAEVGDASQTEETLIDDKTETPADDKAEVPVWSKYASEAGLDAKDETSFISTVKSLTSEVKALKSQIDTIAASGGVSQELKELYALKELSDEALIKENLKASGYEGKELDSEYEAIKEMGDEEREARSIRRRIQGAISKEIQDSKLRVSQKQQQQEESQKKYNAQVNETLSKTESFMGIKLGTTAEQITKFRDQVSRDYQSGKLLEEIFSDPKNVAEISVFWRLKTQLAKKLEDRGKAAGKRSVLEHLGNVNRSTASNLPKNPKKDIPDGEFDADNFLSGLVPS